jgi:sterol desaturase/sphingolipid hydroxylase (fatty acid hydroxylase superfamily)
MLERARELQPYVLTAAFLLLWGAEAWTPHHSRATQWWRHARTNLLLTALYVVAGIGFAAANAWIAQVVLAHQFGLLNWFHASAVVAVPVGVLVLDLAAYAGHIFKHRLPLFWRFHQVHHSDAHLDVTTGFRFHPVEGLISWLFLAPAILLIGIPAASILIFTGLYSLAALVQHANLRWPNTVDKGVRLVFVSPGFHWVHHSPHRHETDSNYGTLFSFWDRLFGTYELPETSSGAFGLGMDDSDSLRGTLWGPCVPTKQKAER